MGVYPVRDMFYRIDMGILQVPDPAADELANSWGFPNFGLFHDVDGQRNTLGAEFPSRRGRLAGMRTSSSTVT